MPVVQSDGHEISYEVAGDGPPLLMIHGAASSGRQFDRARSALEANFRLLIPDLRGMGKSSRVAEAAPQDWLADLRVVLDEAGLDRPMLYGVSLGSRIAARFALEDPQRFRALIVDAPIIGMSASSNKALNTSVSSGPPKPEQVADWERMHGADWSDVVKWYFSNRNRPGFQEYLTTRGELGGLSLPTLVCRGDHADVIHPLDDAIQWHMEAPDSELWIAPGNGPDGSIMLSQPEEFVQQLVRFHARRIA